MLSVVLLLLVDVALAQGITNDTQQAGKDNSSSPDPLLFRLRRQLMADNYDYEKSESSERSEKVLRVASDSQETSQRPAEDDQANVISTEDDKKDDSELSDFTVDRNVLNGYISELSDEDRDADEVREEAAVTENAPAEEETSTKDEWIEVIRNLAPASPYLHGSDTTTELPYKVLTAHGPSRRSGSGAMLRFLKADLNDTVLVAPFGDGPMPLFRLPKSRRQYREDSDGDNITGEDDAPNPS